MARSSSRNRNRARAGSPLNLPGAFQLFGPSKALVLKNIWIFGPLYGVPVLFWARNWIIAPDTGGGFFSHSYGVDSSWGASPIASWDSAFMGYSFTWLLITIVIGTVAQFMVTAAALMASEGKDLDFKDIWQKLAKVIWRLILLSIVVFVVIMVGLFLFIIPGLIMARRYFLASYVLIDRNCGVREAMDRSAAMTKPYSGSIWGIFGVMILIGLVGIIPYVGALVSLALGMLYVVAPALRYQQLKKLAV